MINYLEQLLNELKEIELKEPSLTLYINNIKQKVFALETAIEILTKLKNNERCVENGNVK